MENIIEPVDRALAQFITDKKMWVLRDKLTGKPLNASYTEEGLKYTTSANGKLLYFKDAKLATTWKKDTNGYWEPIKVSFEGDLSMNPDVIVEQFIPQNHSSIRNQVAEYAVMSKAYRFLYHRDS